MHPLDDIAIEAEIPVGATMPAAMSDFVPMLRSLGTLALIPGILAAALWVLRRSGFKPGRQGRAQPRLAVVERLAIKAKTSVSLIRHNDVEHLILCRPDEPGHGDHAAAEFPVTDRVRRLSILGRCPSHSCGSCRRLPDKNRLRYCEHRRSVAIQRRVPSGLLRPGSQR